MPIEEGQEVFRPRFRQRQISDGRVAQHRGEPAGGDRLMPIRSGQTLPFRDGEILQGNVGQDRNLCVVLLVLRFLSACAHFDSNFQSQISNHQFSMCRPLETRLHSGNWKLRIGNLRLENECWFAASPRWFIDLQIDIRAL